MSAVTVMAKIVIDDQQLNGRARDHSVALPHSRHSHIMAFEQPASLTLASMKASRKPDMSELITADRSSPIISPDGCSMHHNDFD